jgi:hypothetical protein
MGKILNFPTTDKIKPVLIRNSRKHRISVEILDDVSPRRTRWWVQFEIQDIAGFGSPIKGFTDRAVANGYRHRFYVDSTRAARHFATMTAPLIASRKIAVWIDGSLVRARPALVA